MSKELKDLISECRAAKTEMGEISKTLKYLKNQLRTFMIDSGIKEFDGVEIRRAFSSFDIELLRLEQPKLFERYCTREEKLITTINNIISKKNMEKIRVEHPELWNDIDYREEGTARLYGL